MRIVAALSLFMLASGCGTATNNLDDVPLFDPYFDQDAVGEAAVKADAKVGAEEQDAVAGQLDASTDVYDAAPDAASADVSNALPSCNSTVDAASADAAPPPNRF